MSKRQHLPALEVYKSQSTMFGRIDYRKGGAAKGGYRESTFEDARQAQRCLFSLGHRNISILIRIQTSLDTSQICINTRLHCVGCGSRGSPPRGTQLTGIPACFSEKSKGRWKTQGRGKHTIKPSPKTVLDPPHLRYISPLPVCSRPVVFFRGNRHRPDQSHFLRPPKLVLESALYSTFCSPKIAR